MPKCEFEEKQYENAANLELARNSPRVFPPGQVLENILGYDVAAEPGDNKIWELLDICIPPGVVLVPNFWEGAPKKPKDKNLPSSLVSLIFQYKRPFYISTANGSQWDHWGKPYFRFQIYNNQHRILNILESNLNRSAVVRYASPAFYKYAELEGYQLDQIVLENTGFIAPSDIDYDANVFTYDGPGTNGYANPIEKLVFVEKFKDVYSLLNEKAVEETLVDHINRLGKLTSDALDDPWDSSFWLNNLREKYPEISQDRIITIDMYIKLTRTLSLASASWWVLEF